MSTFSSRKRFLLLLSWVVLGFAVGCGSSTPEPPKLSEQEQKEAIRRDAEQVMKERQSATKRPQR